MLGGGLTHEGKKAICDMLKANLNVLVWKPTDMTGVPRTLGEQKLGMAKEDEEKTGFYTSQGVFSYSKMPFGFKNAGATYERLVDKAFEKQIGRNLEVYVDDLVIKSHSEKESIRDIKETSAH
ncbi:hypothetical protein Tco_1226281 [Tanacetum coccineum]